MALHNKKKSNLGICHYHLCRKRAEVHKCEWCNEHFCEEHLEAKLPGVKEQWHTPGGHPCVSYFDAQGQINKEYGHALDKLVGKSNSLRSIPEPIIERPESLVTEQPASARLKAENKHQFAHDDPIQPSISLWPIIVFLGLILVVAMVFSGMDSTKLNYNSQTVGDAPIIETSVTPVVTTPTPTLSTTFITPIQIQDSDAKLLSACTQSFNTCKDISTQKYGWSISLIKVEKFEDKIKAEEFYNTWKGLYGQAGLDVDLHLSYGEGYGDPIEKRFPLVLFALKVKSVEQRPLVVICDKSGDLIMLSKQSLQCG